MFSNENDIQTHMWIIWNIISGVLCNQGRTEVSITGGAISASGVGGNLPASVVGEFLKNDVLNDARLIWCLSFIFHGSFLRCILANDSQEVIV